MATRVPVLMYHDLAEERSPISIRPATFDWQMRWLYERGYRAISLDSLSRFVANGARLPDRAVVITFDDGFESTYTSAFPILARYGYTATVFLVSDYCGQHNDWPSQPAGIPRRRLMTWSQASELGRHGIEFGAHSATHPRLDLVGTEQLAREILDAKSEIESRLATRVEYFAYPYGRFGPASKELVRSAYSAAFSTRPGLVGVRSDRAALERIDAKDLELTPLFRSLSAPLLPIYLAVRGGLRSAASTVLGRTWG